MNGILNINKSKGMTSHDVVYQIRKIINIKKVGHTGTLDPMAQGVLPICIAEATKMSQFMIEKDKEYITEITLGSKTDTYDSTGKIIKSSDIIPTKKEILEKLTLFSGKIKQTPPIYSAIKVDGKKLYQYAREKKEIEIKPRDITVHNITLLDYEYPKIRLKVFCSKGTYIRSICNDLGDALGSFGYMSCLIRTKSGPFGIENAVKIEDLQKMNKENIKELLYPLDYPILHFPKVDIKIESSKYLLNGTKLIPKNCVQDLFSFNVDDTVRLYLMDEFKGLGKIIEAQHIKPLRIFK